MMDESMIGRVAEAIRLRGIDRGHPVQPVVLRHLAVTAIEAMREPTEEMIDSGHSKPNDFQHGRITVSEIYEAMIDAALSEKP